MSRSCALGFGLCLLAAMTVTVAGQSTMDELLCTLFPTEPGCDTRTGSTVKPPTVVKVNETCGPGQRCVPNQQCSNASITGEGLLDIRFDASNVCVSYFLQCCYEEDIIECPSRPCQVTTTTSTTTPTTPTSPSRAPPTATPTKPTEPRTEPPATKFPLCGERNPNGVGFRLVGNQANEAEYGELPWMMSILQREELLGEPVLQYACGGSLIHPGVVLTAAHCVRNRNSTTLTVRGGEWDTQTGFETFPTQDRSVVEVVIHPDYYRGGLHNDIALLFLNEWMELDEVVQAVCLPEQDTVFDHQRCIVSGWGKDKYGKQGIYQTILKRLDIPVVPSKQCETVLRETRLKQTFNLHESFLCAGGEKGKDACQGDGGSPLVCAIDGSKHYQQAGIVAWGIGCGEDTIPGVYVAVSRFRQWIDREMGNRNLDISSYEPH